MEGSRPVFSRFLYQWIQHPQLITFVSGTGLELQLAHECAASASVKSGKECEVLVDFGGYPNLEFGFC
jgi:hypothetical protein